MEFVARVSRFQDTVLNLGFSTTATHILTSTGYNEYALIAQGIGSNAQLSAKETVETAEFTYKILRRKRFYIEARVHLLRQLYRTLARRLFRLQGTYPDIACALVVWCVSERHWYVVSTAGFKNYVFESGKFSPVLTETSNYKSNILGISKHIDPEWSQGNLAPRQFFVSLSQDMVENFGETRVLEFLVAGFTQEKDLELLAGEIVGETQKLRAGAHAVLLLKRNIVNYD